MSVLSKINLFIAIVAIVASFYHFFIDNLGFSENTIISFLATMFLLFGIQNVKDNDKDRKLGYTYLIVALIFFTGLTIELFKFL